MREPPHIIKAINALRGVSSDEPITHVPYIRETMADLLVERGYATKTPWSKDPAIPCYRLTHAGIKALDAKPLSRPKLSVLPPRIRPMETRLKPIGKK